MNLLWQQKLCNLQQLNNRSFHVPQPAFLFPLETPLRLSRNFYFPVHHACARAPSCCDTRLRTSHQTCDFDDISWTRHAALQQTRPQSCILRNIWTVIQNSCVYQKQQGSSNVIDKLWLLTEWHIIFHKAR